MTMLWEGAQNGKPTVPYPQAEDEDSPGTFTKIKGKNGAANMRVIGANDNKLNVNVDGSIDVDVGNWPSTYACTQSGAWNITSITNVVHVDDNSSTISIDDGSGSITVDGSISVSNFPATQPVSGTVAVSSLPSVTVGAAIPAGDNNIGNVDVASMPVVEEAHLHSSYDAENTAIKVNVVAGSSSIGSVSTTHHTAVVAPADGTDASVDGYKIITVQINGTSASRTVQFFGSVDGVAGSFYPVMGVNMATWDSAVSTTGTGELWQFDIAGLGYFRARVNAVSGGNVTVKSNAVV